MTKKPKATLLNKKKLIQIIFRKISAADIINNSISKNNIEVIFNMLVDVISDTLVNGGKVKISKFGTFFTVKHNARKGRNPVTGEAVSIPSCERPKFKFCNIIKESCSNPQAVKKNKK